MGRTLDGRVPQVNQGAIWSQVSLKVQRLPQLPSEGGRSSVACNVAWKDKEGPPARVWAPLGAGKSEEKFSPGLSRRSQPYRHLTLPSETHVSLLT